MTNRLIILDRNDKEVYNQIITPLQALDLLEYEAFHFVGSHNNLDAITIKGSDSGLTIGTVKMEYHPESKIPKESTITFYDVAKRLYNLDVLQLIKPKNK